MNKKNMKTNLIFAAVLLAAALVLWLMTSAGGSAPADLAVLTYGADGRTMEIPLDRDERYDIDTGKYVIHLEVKDGAVRFVDSPCPDHICEGYGWLSKDGDWAACLPAMASLTVMEAES